MIFRYIPAVALLCMSAVLPSSLHGQRMSDDPVLFSVGNDNVSLSEFNYVYKKSNGETADYSKKSVEEFLDLYQKFKLKVADARAQGMEDNGQLEAELAQYRDQLADNYMSDDAMLDRLTKELYERMKWDIDVSHILRRVPPNAPEYLKKSEIQELEEARKALVSGVDFSAVAKKYSQDQTVSENGGHLGYRHAKLPDGFYELETVLYNTPGGELGGPVHSRMGYHLIKVNGRRPDPGTIEVAHILIRKPRPGLVDSTKQIIDGIYAKLKKGADFGKLANDFSQDSNNSRQKGYLGKFKTGTYDPAFEKAAFAIQEDGGFSPPVHTDYGWHIIQRLSLETLGDYESEKRNIENLVRSDSRYKLAQDALIEQIKKQEGFQKMEVSNEDLFEILTNDVFQINWNVPEISKDIDLFQIRDSVYDLNGFVNYLAQNLDARYQRGVVPDPPAEIGNILNNYINYAILEFEKAHLEEKYPEFREIMREYREGIMLFEISKEKIWDRAGQDTAGLHRYYDQHRADYHSPRSIQYDNYTVNTLNSRVLSNIEKLIRKKKPEKILKKLNKAADVVKYSNQNDKENLFAEKFDANSDQLKVGEVFEKSDKDSGVTMFGYIQQIESGNPLKFEEARGSVMSDYQKHLEDQWLAELQNKYDVKINESVLQSIIKS